MVDRMCRAKLQSPVSLCSNHKKRCSDNHSRVLRLITAHHVISTCNCHVTKAVFIRFRWCFPRDHMLTCYFTKFTMLLISIFYLTASQGYQGSKLRLVLLAGVVRTQDELPYQHFLCVIRACYFRTSTLQTRACTHAHCLSRFLLSAFVFPKNLLAGPRTRV